MLVVSLALQQVKEVGAVTQKEINNECKILSYIHLTLMVFGLVMAAILHYRKLELVRGHMFSNAVKIIIFISDVQYYVPIKLCKTAKPSIQNYRHAKLQKCKIKLKLRLGYLRNRLEGSQHDFQW